VDVVGAHPDSAAVSAALDVLELIDTI